MKNPWTAHGYCFHGQVYNQIVRRLVLLETKIHEPTNRYDIETETKESLLSYCSYVQWVPGSDVIVAQNRNQLSVWYNLDDLERVSHISVKGDVINIERKTGKTEIIVQEGSSNVGYKLDEELIEFGTAIDDGDLNRALDYLESLPKEHQGADAMWKSLAKIAMEKEIVHIAIRCFAAVGDIPKVRYLQKIEWIQITHEAETGQDGNENLEAKALLAQLNNDFNVAEQLYIENGDVDKAIDMYVKVKRWDDAIRVTERLVSKILVQREHMRFFKCIRRRSFSCEGT